MKRGNLSGFLSFFRIMRLRNNAKDLKTTIVGSLLLVVSGYEHFFLSLNSEYIVFTAGLGIAFVVAPDAAIKLVTNIVEGITGRFFGKGSK